MNALRIPCLLLIAAVSSSVFAASARAAACEAGTAANVCLLVPDGSSSDDVSPYCFLPTLARGQATTDYAVTAQDDTGQCHNFETYFKFELPSGLLIPGETVTSAYLDVPYSFSFSISGPPTQPPHPPVTLRVHRVTSPWTEDGVSWNRRPAYDPTPLDSVSGITNFRHVIFDVTDVVRAWAHGTAANNGFVLTSPDDRVLGFYSWEASEPEVPESLKIALLITRGPGAAPPACGDVDADGDVDSADVARYRAFLVDPAGHPLGTDGTARCNVIAAGQPCSLRDTVVIRRSLAQPPLAPGIAATCSAVAGP
jgi:hypothetical protein